MKKLNSISLLVGGFLTFVGVLGIIFKFHPPYDGEMAITGAVIFAAGVIANSMKS